VTDLDFLLRAFVNVIHFAWPLCSSIEGRVAADGGSTSTHFPYISAHTFESVNGRTLHTPLAKVRNGDLRLNVPADASAMQLQLKPLAA
jgi:hypothetical protein